MNCEKCKNKKATLFYADEGGRRHALCAACGASFNKLGKYEGYTVTEEEAESYLPIPNLYGYPRTSSPEPLYVRIEEDIKCPSCHASASEISDSGELKCPHCYSAFAQILPPAIAGYATVGYAAGAAGRVGAGAGFCGAKMPIARRRAAEKQIRLDELRAKLRSAISSESFELAAKLRDQIKAIDAAN